MRRLLAALALTATIALTGACGSTTPTAPHDHSHEAVESTNGPVEIEPGETVQVIRCSDMPPERQVDCPFPEAVLTIWGLR